MGKVEKGISLPAQNRVKNTLYRGIFNSFANYPALYFQIENLSWNVLTCIGMLSPEMYKTGIMQKYLWVIVEIGPLFVGYPLPNRFFCDMEQGFEIDSTRNITFPHG